MQSPFMYSSNGPMFISNGGLVQDHRNQAPTMQSHYRAQPSIILPTHAAAGLQSANRFISPQMQSSKPPAAPASFPRVMNSASAARKPGPRDILEQTTITHGSSVNPVIVNSSNSSSASLRKSARAWARRVQLPSNRLEELDQLVSLGEATYISKSRVKNLRPMDTGNFGQIYQAVLDASPVAVKEFSTQNGSPVLLTKMREILLELTILVRLRHPNIVTFWGTSTEFPENAQPYMGFVFELCDKGSLYKMLHESTDKKCLTPKTKLNMARQVGFGLSYLHTKRKDDKRAIVHRDISSRNILLTGPSDNLLVKIADFGVARVMIDTTLATTTISGSPPYMAPEQLIGSHLTVQCDLWSFGVLIWEIISEQLPWATADIKFPSIQQMTDSVIGKQETLKFTQQQVDLYPAEVTAMTMQCFKMHGDSRPLIDDMTDKLEACYQMM